MTYSEYKQYGVILTFFSIKRKGFMIVVKF